MELAAVLAALSEALLPTSHKKALSYKALELAMVGARAADPHEDIGQLFSDFEGLMAGAKNLGIVGVGNHTAHLSRGGFYALANRVRSMARGRGALADQNGRLRKEVRDVFAGSCQGDAPDPPQAGAPQ